MTNHRLNYLLVGLFTLAMLGGIIASVLVLSGGAGATDRYHTTLGNVADIKYGTQVLFEGFPIGQVETVTPFSESGRVRFRVEFTVRQGWQIPAASHLQPGASGLLSTVTLNIQPPGPDDAADQGFLSPGQPVAGRDRTDLFAVFSSLGDEMTALSQGDIRPLLARVGRVVDLVAGLLDREGRVVMGNLDRISGDLARQVPVISRDLSEFSGSLGRIGGRVERIVGQENEAKVLRMVGNLDTAAADIARLTRELKGTRRLLDRVLAGAQRVVDDNDGNLQRTVENSREVVESAARHIDAIALHLENTSRNMDEFSRRIRLNPGLLIGGDSPGDAAAAQGNGRGGSR